MGHQQDTLYEQNKIHLGGRGKSHGRAHGQDQETGSGTVGFPAGDRVGQKSDLPGAEKSEGIRYESFIFVSRPGNIGLGVAKSCGNLFWM